MSGMLRHGGGGGDSYFTVQHINKTDLSVMVNYINYYVLHVIIRSCRQRNIEILCTFIKSLII